MIVTRVFLFLKRKWMWLYYTLKWYFSVLKIVFLVLIRNYNYIKFYLNDMWKQMFSQHWHWVILMSQTWEKKMKSAVIQLKRFGGISSFWSLKDRIEQNPITNFNCRFHVVYWRLCRQYWPPDDRKLNLTTKFSMKVIISFTFLNWSRLPSIIPKHPMTIGSCVLIKIVGNSRFTPIGNKYQSNRSNRLEIFSNKFVSCWPISHEKNIKMNAESS